MVYISAAPDAGPAAAAAERFGYDGFWTTETQADSLIACAVAAPGATTASSSDAGCGP